MEGSDEILSLPPVTIDDSAKDGDSLRSWSITGRINVKGQSRGLIGTCKSLISRSFPQNFKIGDWRHLYEIVYCLTRLHHHRFESAIRLCISSFSVKHATQFIVTTESLNSFLSNRVNLTNWRVLKDGVHSLWRKCSIRQKMTATVSIIQFTRETRIVLQVSILQWRRAWQGGCR